MAIHTQCGADIEWPRREDDPERFGRPLEFAGQAYILTEEGYAIRVLTYKQHECDPDVMEAWIERCRRIDELKQNDVVPSSYEAYQVKREEILESQWKAALKVECSKCGAKKRNKCRSLAKHENSRILKRPHWERVKDSEKEFGLTF